MSPLRATASRYYRSQNLSINEVDSQGENLPMYVSNMHLSEQGRLKKWLLKNFHLDLEIKSAGGHISMMVQEQGSKEIFNITDTGFGFSQVMPILVQLWGIIFNADESPRRRRNSGLQPIIFSIEQPELHLHPYMQAKLAAVFCSAIKTAKEANVDIRIIIETHSEAIVNRIGQEIADKKCDSENVNVVLFTKNPQTSLSEVTTADYNSVGQLTNWPWGFFDARP